jgi:hypothetical protein
MKCEYVAEIGKTHTLICDQEATQIIECLVPNTGIWGTHKVCDRHAERMRDKYTCKKEVKKL